jgi:hypothetical protein
VRSANIVGPDNVVGIAIAVGSRPGDRTQMVIRFPPPFPYPPRPALGPTHHPLQEVTGLFPRGLKQRGLALATQPHLALKLRMSVAFP